MSLVTVLFWLFDIHVVSFYLLLAKKTHFARVRATSECSLRCKASCKVRIKLHFIKLQSSLVARFGGPRTRQSTVGMSWKISLSKNPQFWFGITNPPFLDNIAAGSKWLALQHRNYKTDILEKSCKSSLQRSWTILHIRRNYSFKVFFSKKMHHSDAFFRTGEPY